MLTAIFSQFGMSIINGLLDKILDAFTAYESKQISIEELKTRLYEAMLGAVKDIETAHADALAKTYQAFMGALVQSPLMQRVWATAALSELFVLVYHQIGIPLIVLIVRASYDGRWQYPSSGTTVEWAYLLLGALMGMAPMVLRAGPGAGSIADRLKAIVGK